MAARALAGAWIQARARDRGLRGASGAWLAIWVLLTAGRWIRKWAAPEPVVAREVLRPGEQLVVTHYPKGTAPVVEGRRGRRRR